MSAMLAPHAHVPSHRARANARTLHCKPHRLICRSEQARASASTSKAELRRLWLSARGVQRSVQLQLVPEGKGQAVVVAQVQPGSEADEAGVSVGQKLVAISDPVRDAQVWDLGLSPSMRFIRDTLQMRARGQVQLVLEDGFLSAAEIPGPAGQIAVAAQPQASSSQDDGAPQAAQGAQGGELPPQVQLLDSLLSASDDDQPDQVVGLTVGDRMAAQYEVQQRAMEQQNEVSKRMAKRKAYLEQVSDRNDTWLISGLLVAFLGPPLVILLIAAGTGYLDKLYNLSLTLR